MEVAKVFREKHLRKPLVLGCVDGTHIQVVSPKRDREAVFINRKGFYSLNVMVSNTWPFFLCTFNYLAFDFNLVHITIVTYF